MAYAWSNNSTTKVRVPGGGNTYFKAGIATSLITGQTDAAPNDAKIDYLEFMSDYTDTPGTANGQTTPIHPIGSPYPVEIATAYAQNAGTLQLRFWQQWGVDGWYGALAKTGIFDNLDTGKATDANSNSPYSYANLTLTNWEHYPVDLYNVFRAQRKAGGHIALYKYELAGDGNLARIKSYGGAVISDVSQPESNINVSSMTVMCTVTVMYCYSSVYFSDSFKSNAAKNLGL